MYYKYISVFFVVFLSFFCTTSFAQETATSQLKPTIENLNAILADENLKGDSKKPERREKVMVIIKERFHFRLMSQMILRRGWKKLSDTEKEEFTGLMTTLLEHAYIGQLEEYSGGAVRFLQEKEKKNGTIDVTTAIDYNDQEVYVHYVMIKIEEEWMVYEVKIESFSLIATYSDQFQPIFRKKGYTGLVEAIESKITSLSQVTEGS